MKKFTPTKNSVVRFILITLLVHFLSEAFSQNSVTTHAGSSQGFMDATGTAARFTAPTGICISADGQFLFVADYSGHRIRKINVSTKAVTTVAGNGTSGYADGVGTAARFSYPSGICISTDGTILYVSDYGNSYIRKIIIATQTVSTIAGNGTFAYADNIIGLSAAFNSPTDIVNNGDSILYITDTENQLIRKFNISTTEVSTLAGMVGVAGFQNGIGTNAAFRYPKGMAVSEDGTTLFVADNGNNMIRSINLSTKNVITVAGDGTAGYANNSNGLLAKLNSPNGVAIVLGNPDLLYVADNANHRIRQINLSTTSVTTIAGDGSVPPASTFADNSVGMNAKFFYPTTLTISPDGKDIYVADQGNFKIRKIKTDLSMATINENMNNLSLQVYPNPSSDIIIINMANLKDKKIKMELYNSAGEMVLQNEKNNSDGLFMENVSAFPAGIYMLIIHAENRSASQKIIITK